MVLCHWGCRTYEFPYLVHYTAQNGSPVVTPKFTVEIHNDVAVCLESILLRLHVREIER